MSAAVVEDKIFRALADPSRRAIFESLTRGEAAVKDLTARFDISQPAVSQHLATLKDAGLVNGRREGRLCLLPGGAARDEAAHRLDRALPRLLDGARRSPRRTAGENGRMTLIDKTAPSQTECHFIRVRFASFAGEGVARAHRPRAAHRVAPARRRTQARAGGRVHVQDAAASRVGRHRELPDSSRSNAHRKLSYTWVVGDMPDTVVTFTLTPTASGTRLSLVQSGFKAAPEAELRRRALRLEDDGREARRPAREDPMSRSRLVPSRAAYIHVPGSRRARLQRRSH